MIPYIGLFASGSMDKRMTLYTPIDENCSDWTKDSHPYIVHGDSVEDIQFSPKDDYLIASCRD